MRIPKIMAVFMATLVVVWWFFPFENSTVIKYQLEPLTKGEIKSGVNSVGRISPETSVEVGSEVSGLIAELLVDFNSKVTKKQVIARIDDRTYLTRLAQVKADLTAAQANIDQQNAQLTRVNIELAQSEREWHRIKDLYQRNLSSTQELDKAETAYLLATSSKAISAAALASTKAKYQQQLALLQQVELELDRTYIRSPVNGVIIDIKVDIGQAVSASLSAPELFTIAKDLTRMQIEADIDEADIGNIEVGQKAEFTVDAYPNRHFVGVVKQIRKASSVNSGVVTYKVILEISNKDEKLLPGMTASIDIVTGMVSNALLVPNAALRFTPPDYVEAKDNSTASRLIERVSQKVTLTDEQKQQIKEMLEGQQQNNRSSGRRGGAMRSVLQKVLTKEQLTQFQETNNKREDGRTKRGTVWVMQDDKPVKITVQLGISNTEFTQIISELLDQNDQVITRAIRAGTQ